MSFTMQKIETFAVSICYYYQFYNTIISVYLTFGLLIRQNHQFDSSPWTPLGSCEGHLTTVQFFMMQTRKTYVLFEKVMVIISCVLTWI